MNKCILVGNLTRDPEVNTTGSGITMCKFTVAVNRAYANANGEREADFLNIVTWRSLAENCSKYLTKGSKVAVSGAIQTRTFEVDGQKRYATDIVAEDVEFLNRVTGGEGAGSSAPSQPKKQNAELKPIDSEDLPF